MFFIENSALSLDVFQEHRLQHIHIDRLGKVRVHPGVIALLRIIRKGIRSHGNDRDFACIRRFL